ncbi:unnamed protein product [Symbiodinium sp. CCMP2592]|nr:unnamed protein product [Symbiodinium sp. CCMP2592]
MTTSGGDSARSKDWIPQWDGSAATFQQYEEEALLWQEGIDYYKRYTAGPRLVAALQGAARRMVVGRPVGWVSFPGGVEVLLQYLRGCLGRPQVSEMTDYLSQYFRHSRRKHGESINDYITRKSEIYTRAQQALSRVRPHHEPRTVPTNEGRGNPYYARRSSWSSEATTTVGEAAEDDDQETTDGAATSEPQWSYHEPRSWHQNNWTWNGSSSWGQSWWPASQWNEGRWSGNQHQWRPEPGVAHVELLPDWVQGWYLLQDANLTTSERNMVHTALKGNFGLQRVAQELRNQWADADLKRRDQQHRSSGFLGEAELDEDENEAWAVEDQDDDGDLNEEGQALVAEATAEARQALAAIQGNITRVALDLKAAPFVCYAEQALAGGFEAERTGKVLTTAEAVAEGFGVIDGGATKTLGSVRALESIMKKNLEKRGDSGLREVDPSNRPTFGFADSGEAQCVSTVALGLQASGQDGKLQVHALNKGTGPVLVSVATLRKLEAIIDFRSDLMVLRALDPTKVIKLERSATGHQLVNLTEDLFKGATAAKTAVPSLMRSMSASHKLGRLSHLLSRVLHPSSFHCPPNTMGKIDRMTKPQLREAIETFGEYPAEAWTVAELRHRLLELVEEDEETWAKTAVDDKTPLQQAIQKLNKYKQRKATLQDYTENVLGVEVGPNETMSQIEQKTMNHLYLTTESSGRDIVGFGRHAALTYAEVLQTYPQYAEWVRQTHMETDETNPRLKRFATWLLKVLDVMKPVESPQKGGVAQRPVLKVKGGYLYEPEPEAARAAPKAMNRAASSTDTPIPTQQMEVMQTMMEALQQMQSEMRELRELQTPSEERPRKKEK